MNPDFWRERWQNNQIGFHQSSIHPGLKRFMPQLNLKAGDQVFVPLCGKSLDMCWLAEQGLEVLGIELSPLAVQAFFAEQGMLALPARHQNFDSLKSDKYQILIGDIFDLTSDHTSAVAATYDRASLIALPPDMRPAYASHLANILPTGAPVLLVTLEYPQAEMSGPPFSVTGEEVRDLFAGYQVEELARTSILDAEPHFKAQGLTSLEECTWLLRK